jgi:2'-deoxynucleoside 5'-phosphate N-hydrolase
MKIYFSGSIRGGRQDAELYRQLIDELNNYGTVLTEHIGAESIDHSKSDKEIHDEDMAWLRESDIVVAEVTTPSLGVGYEIGRAVVMGKPILCLFRPNVNSQISAMVKGSPDVEFVEYGTLQEAMESLASFFEKKTLLKIRP